MFETLVTKIKGIDEVREGFKRHPRFSVQVMDQTVKKTALMLVESIKRNTPVKTSALKTSIRADFSPLRAIIAPHQPYALYVHEGTGIYGKSGQRIRPKTKKALYWKGALHPVKSVRGQKPQPFMERGYQEARDNIQREFDIAVSKIINNLKGK